MSTGRKRADKRKLPITHCAEGRWAGCRDFRRLVSSGKNPTNCPYYNHCIDRKN